MIRALHRWLGLPALVLVTLLAVSGAALSVFPAAERISAPQAEQAMKNVKQLLEEAGSDLSHIVKTTTYIIDPRYREPVYQEVGKWLKGVFPISTGLVISALAQPQWLMEIDVIAVIPDDAAK